MAIDTDFLPRDQVWTGGQKTELVSDGPTRELVLNEAKVFAQEHPVEYFKTIAGFWNAYLEDVDRPLSLADVAALLALLKMAQQKRNPARSEAHIGAAGYSACAAELFR